MTTATASTASPKLDDFLSRIEHLALSAIIRFREQTFAGVTDPVWTVELEKRGPTFSVHATGKGETLLAAMTLAFSAFADATA